MNEKKRVALCIAHKKTDRIPWQIDCTVETAARLIRAFGLDKKSHPVRIIHGRDIYRYTALQEHLGNHLCYVRTESPQAVREVEPMVWEDEWGIRWDRHVDRDIGTPVNTLLDDMDVGRLRLPDPDEPTRFEHIQPVIEANENRFVVAKVSRCLFERAWSLRGMQNLMMDFIQAPDFVHALFDRLTDFAIRLIRNLHNFSIDAVRFSDDWGCQRGLLMSPGMWRRFLKPYLKRMFGQAREQGYGVFIHSCGDITSILDDLIEIRVDVFNPFQPEVMDIEKVIETYAGRIGFNGGLSIQKTLPFGGPDEVKSEVLHRLKLAHRFGGYIIGPSHDMPRDIPIRNVQAMLDVLKAQAPV